MTNPEDVGITGFIGASVFYLILVEECDDFYLEMTNPLLTDTTTLIGTHVFYLILDREKRKFRTAQFRKIKNPQPTENTIFIGHFYAKNQNCYIWVTINP